LDNGVNIYNYSTNISRIAAELYKIPSQKQSEKAFNATKELMKSMNLESQNREDKIKLAKERIRTGYYNRKDVKAKIANEILKEFDLD
jgi:hypothetical protein